MKLLKSYNGYTAVKYLVIYILATSFLFDFLMMWPKNYENWRYCRKTIKKCKKLIRKLSNMPFSWKPLHKYTHKYHRLMKLYIFWMMLVFGMKFGHFLANFGQKTLFLTVFWSIRGFFLKVQVSHKSES